MNSEGSFRIYTSHLYCKSSERVTQGFTVRGSWRRNRTAIYWQPTLMAVNIVSFSFSRAAQPKGLWGSAFCWGAGFLNHILSPTALQNYWGPRGSLWPGVAFLPQLASNSNLLTFCLDRVIVQRPLNRLLNLLNGMFDPHQAGK